MNEKSASDTTISDFKKRFPTKEAWVEWLLRQPRSKKTAADFHAEAAKRRLRDH